MKTVLIIEDDRSYSKVLTTSLAKDGYRIIVQNSANRALEFIRLGNSVDLIILDLKLPDAEGFSLMDQIKKLLDVPIVINSGYSYFKRDFSSWLADAYVDKSADLNELKQVIHEVLQN